MSTWPSGSRPSRAGLMPLGFTYDVHAPRVVFGRGALHRLPEELERLGAQRVLVLCTPGRAETLDQVRAGIGERLAAVFDRARMHVPAELVEEAMAAAGRSAADLCLSIGGGSAIGLAKAVALRGGLSSVAVPTTYAGSEMTPIWGITDQGRKTTGRDRRVVPRTVIYDPALTLTLPPRDTASSGMNALAHCVEALYAADANPLTGLLAEEGIRALAWGLPLAVREPADLEARSAALYGAWLAGSSLAAVSMGLHHRICHVLGGAFDLPHAETHAVVLPHVAAYNTEAAPEAMRRIAGALGADEAAAALYDLAAALGCLSSLRDLGLRKEDLDPAAALVVEKPYPNPRPCTREEVRVLLEEAYHGRRPGPRTKC